MIDLCNVCKACKNSDLIITNGNCGFPTCGAVNSFKDFSPRENRGEKTLLDEFAMAALTGSLSNPEVMLDIAEEDLKSLAKAYSICSYEYAAAMMRERNRRDEMGNVKEATE